MNWFGRKAAGRDGSRPVLAHVGHGSVIGEWPRSYEAQVREAYLGNPVAQRAVRIVAEGAGEAPVVASVAQVAALLSAQSAGQGLIETLASQLMLHGNAYVQLLGDGRGGSERVVCAAARAG